MASKQELTNIYISQAWSRTVVFLKLTRHKSFAGNLPGDWEEYKLALIAEFQKAEREIGLWNFQDMRGGDRKTLSYRDTLKNKVVCWNRRDYDETLREIIKKIENSYN